jgi:predicted kinase
VWKTVADMPSDVKAAITRPYTAAELKNVRDIAGIDRVMTVPQDQRPKLLMVIGPAGAGKSSCLRKACDMMNLDLETFVQIDGDEFRTAHGGYNEHIKQNLAVGYQGAFKYVQANSTWENLKHELKTEAVQKRKNLCWGACSASKLKHVRKLPNFQDYDIYVLGLMVDWEEIYDRGHNRSELIGRGHKPNIKNWECALRDIVKLCDETMSKGCMVIENTDFAHPRVIYSRIGQSEDLAAESAKKLATQGLALSPQGKTGA